MSLFGQQYQNFKEEGLGSSVRTRLKGSLNSPATSPAYFKVFVCPVHVLTRNIPFIDGLKPNQSCKAKEVS